MKIVILGSTGMLGSALMLHLKNQHDVVGLARSEGNFTNYTCDFTCFDTLADILDYVDADIIINCAAITDLNYCERNINDAFMLHYYLPLVLSKRRELCIYISTDSVFDGFQGNYSEDSLTCPLNVYSMSKLLGELPVLDSGGLVLRTNIYGFNRCKWGKSLFEWVIDSVTSKSCITGYSDVYFNPVSIFELSSIISKFIQGGHRGIYNIGCEMAISKGYFIQEIISIIDPGYNLLTFDCQPMTSVIRPRNTTLRIEKFTNDFGWSVDFNRDLENTLVLYSKYKTNNSISDI